MAWPFMPRSLTDSVLVKAVERASRRQRIFYALLGLGSYLALASSLRFRRRNKMQKAYPYRTREAMGKMTDYDAWAIQKQMLQMEFPFIILKSLQFALFRVRIIDPTVPPVKLTTATDLWYSDDIKPTPQDITTFGFHHLIQTIR